MASIGPGRSHCASLTVAGYSRQWRGLHGVGVTFSGAQGALDLFLAQPFIWRYEVPREDCEDRYRAKDCAGKVERLGLDRVEERRDRDLNNTTQQLYKKKKYKRR